MDCFEHEIKWMVCSKIDDDIDDKWNQVNQHHWVDSYRIKWKHVIYSGKNENINLT